MERKRERKRKRKERREIIIILCVLVCVLARDVAKIVLDSCARIISISKSNACARVYARFPSSFSSIRILARI